MDAKSRPLLLLIAFLLAANLVVQFVRPGAPAQLLPAAQAQQAGTGGVLCPAPLERRTFQGATVLTASPGGDRLYVWNTDVVNGKVTATSHVFVAPR
jgi:hypothetical protein